MDVNHVTGQIVDAAIKVHRVLGPGCLESTYQACLVHELRRRGLRVAAQVELPAMYEGLRIDVGYRVDLIVEELVMVELKAVKKMIPIFDAQLLSYLKMSDHRVGLLINFHVGKLKDGIKRIVNGL